MEPTDGQFQIERRPSLTISPFMGFMFDMRNDQLKIMDRGVWLNQYNICRNPELSFPGTGFPVSELPFAKRHENNEQRFELNAESDSSDDDRKVRFPLTRKFTPIRRGKLRARSSVRGAKINNINRLCSKSKISPRKNIRVNESGNNKPKYPNISEYRKLRLDLGDFERDIRKEKQKERDLYREKGKNARFDYTKLNQLKKAQYQCGQEMRDMCDHIGLLQAQLKNAKNEQKEETVVRLTNTLNWLDSNWDWESILREQFGFIYNHLSGILHNVKPYMVNKVGQKEIDPGDVNKHKYTCHYTSMEAAVSILKSQMFWASSTGTWGAGFYVSQYLPNKKNARDTICMNSFGSRENKEFKIPEWQFRRDSGCCDVGIILCVPENIIRDNKEFGSQNQRIVQKIGNTPEDRVTFSLKSKDVMKEGEVIDIKNAQHFRGILKQNRHTLIVINFSASWCGPSKMMEEVFSRLAKKYRNCIFLHLDTDDVSLIAEEYSINAMPTFVFLGRNNIAVKDHQIRGAHSDKLVDTVKKLSKVHAKCVFPGQGHSLRNINKHVGTCTEYVNVWADSNFLNDKLKKKQTKKIDKELQITLTRSSPQGLMTNNHADLRATDPIRSKTVEKTPWADLARKKHRALVKPTIDLATERRKHRKKSAKKYGDYI